MIVNKVSKAVLAIIAGGTIAVAQLPPPVTPTSTAEWNECYAQQCKDFTEAFKKCGISVKPIYFEKWGPVSKGPSDAASNRVSGETVPAGKFWWVLYSGIGTNDNPPLPLDFRLEVRAPKSLKDSTKYFALPHIVYPGGTRSDPGLAMNGADRTFLFPCWYLNARSNKLAAGNSIRLWYFALEFNLCDFPLIALGVK